MSNSSTEVHLIVLIHGLWGNPTHLAELKRHVLERWQTNSDIELLVASSISDDLTYDGIDWGAERVAKEVIGKIRDIEEHGRVATKFSTIGYSLGGLVGRYLIGILCQKGYFQDGPVQTSQCMKPLNFVTIATPHLGLPRYPGLLSSLSSSMGGSLLSRTGRQLCLSDTLRKGDSARKASNGVPLLENLVDPDQIFFRALSMFESVAIYANAVNDVSVPYMTGAIEPQDPFYADESYHIEAELDEVYCPILKSWRIKPTLKSRGQFILPPYLRFEFPYNMLVYPLLPLLAPVAIGAAVIRLGISSRKSRARVRALEEDLSFAEALFHSVEVTRKDSETRKIDSGELSVNVDVQQAILASNEAVLAEAGSSAKAGSKKHLPRLSDKQIAISRSLNALPHLRKYLVWIHPIRNSHAHIICRDIEIFPSQKVGEGVLRHVADHLLI